MAETLTPMMQQYQSIRRGLPANTLLLFRLGDFYEMFFEDAREAAAILNVALTKRGQTPMCGVPFHAAEGYIAKLIKAGRRVAICDQIGEPQPGRIVERALTQIISPGTVSDVNLLDSKRSNYLAAALEIDGVFGFAFVDLTTGDFRMTELADESALADELARVAPAEILVSDEQTFTIPELAGATPADGYTFLHDHAYFALRDHFKVQSLAGFGCEAMRAGIGAAGAILHYLKHGLRRQVAHITRLTSYHKTEFMVLDAVTQANLELVHSRGARDTSLLAALDRTVTPMGGRRLRDWILHPLCAIEPLRDRQAFLAELLAEPFLLSQCRESLRGVRDIERTLGRLSQAGGNARDLVALRGSLEQIPELKTHLAACGKAAHLSDGWNGATPAGETKLRAEVTRALHEFPHLISLLTSALADEPPLAVREGGIFRDGYSGPLDELRAAGREGKDWIAQLQQKEIEATGIKSLKVRYTSVFGYFIEITKSNLGSVPAHYIRKQTTVNGERFITPELKEMEGKILGADERARNLEYELFVQLREEVLQSLRELQEAAAAIATADVVCALAETARLFGYCQPVLTSESRIAITDGRHPVLDQSLVEEKFVPNDVELDGASNRLMIITGPNMAGKSTYIRQVALLVLMAQIGSFIPAARAEIGLVDRIFTRVGASDDLSRGQSTFMVEMNETANITNNATALSLVILDEIGRGTSTFDGLSIAWSVAEYLHDSVKCRTLFATHYHELTELEMTRPGVKNYNVAVREWNDQIIFLRKIIRGGADKSYGIQVARLAGLPGDVITRAKEILGNLELAELNADGKPKLAETPPRKSRSRKPGKPSGKPQLSLF
jgi:DNA mismatch repair protein MutS